jgi:hypothetical protein
MVQMYVIKKIVTIITNITSIMVKFRNLDKVRFIMKEATELDVAYAYEDLVFSEHGLFIIRFDDNNDDNLFCYFNKDCIPVKQKLVQTQLAEVCDLNSVRLLYKGTFEMNQIENAEEFELKLYEA